VKCFGVRDGIIPDYFPLIVDSRDIDPGRFHAQRAWQELYPLFGFVARIGVFLGRIGQLLR
jgi:hypothetical protein